MISSNDSRLKLIPMRHTAGASDIPAVLVVPGTAFFTYRYTAWIILCYDLQAIRADMFLITHQLHIIVDVF